MLWVSETGAFTVSSVHGVHTGRDMTVRYAELLLPPPLIETKPGPAGGLGTVAVVAGRPGACWAGWPRPDGSCCYHV